MKNRICYIFAILLCACSHKYLPIVQLTKNYPPVEHARYVNVVPESAVFIGTIKVVPRDYSFETRKDYKAAIYNLQEAAAKTGANYIYVTYVSAQNSDYYSKFFNALTADYGEGFTIEAELYR